MGLSHYRKEGLLSVLGHLNYAIHAIFVMRSLISRIIEAKKVPVHLDQHTTLGASCKADIRMWLSLLTDWNGISLFVEEDVTSAHDSLKVYTDASRSYGFGGWNELTGIATPGCSTVGVPPALAGDVRLTHAVSHYQQAAISDSTRAAYQSGIRAFQVFCAMFRVALNGGNSLCIKEVAGLFCHSLCQSVGLELHYYQTVFMCNT